MNHRGVRSNPNEHDERYAEREPERGRQVARPSEGQGLARGQIARVLARVVDGHFHQRRALYRWYRCERERAGQPIGESVVSIERHGAGVLGQPSRCPQGGGEQNRNARSRHHIEGPAHREARDDLGQRERKRHQHERQRGDRDESLKRGCAAHAQLGAPGRPGDPGQLGYPVRVGGQRGRPRIQRWLTFRTRESSDPGQGSANM
jgi:hypothetical protein